MLESAHEKLIDIQMNTEINKHPIQVFYCYCKSGEIIIIIIIIIIMTFINESAY